MKFKRILNYRTQTIIYLFFILFITDTLNAFKIVNINNLVDLLIFIMFLKAISVMLREKLYKQVRVQLWFMVIFIMYVTFNAGFTIISGRAQLIDVLYTIKILFYFPVFLYISSVYLKNQQLIQKTYHSLFRMINIASIIGIFITIYNLNNNIIQEGYRVYSLSVLSLGVPLILIYFLKIGYNKSYLLTGLISVLFIILTYAKQFYLSLLLIVILFIMFFIKKRNLFSFRLVKLFLIVFLILTLLNYTFNIELFYDIKLAIEHNFYLLTDMTRIIEDAGSQYRIFEMKYAFEAWKQEPIFGIGISTKYTDFGLESWTHNSWLWLLLDVGIVGMGIYLMPIIVSLKSFFSLKRKERKSEFSIIVSFVGLILISVNALFAPLFFRSIEANLLLGLFVSVLINSKYLSKSERI